MNERGTAECKSNKYYDFPLSVLGGGYHRSKKLQMKNNCTCHRQKQVNDLETLKPLKTKKKSQELDEKIKNLKSELSSLVGECSKLYQENNYGDAKFSGDIAGIKQVHKTYERSISYTGGTVDVNLQHGRQKPKKPDNGYDKKEFSQWLNSTIDSFSGTGNSKREKVKKAPAPKNVSPDRLEDEKLEDDSKFTKVAKELIYESFLAKRFPHYEPNQEVEEVPVQPMNLSKRKHERTEESRYPSTKKTKTCDKKRGNHRVRTLTIHDSSDSEVEVIDIDDDSNSSPPVNIKVELKEEKPKVVEIIENEPTPEKGQTEKGNSNSRGVWECPICFEQNTGQEIVTTMCGHVFCKRCLDEYYNTRGRTCPTCRTDLHDKPVITLFNF